MKKSSCLTAHCTFHSLRCSIVCSRQCLEQKWSVLPSFSAVRHPCCMMSSSIEFKSIPSPKVT